MTKVRRQFEADFKKIKESEEMVVEFNSGAGQDEIPIDFDKEVQIKIKIVVPDFKEGGCESKRTHIINITLDDDL